MLLDRLKTLVASGMFTEGLDENFNFTNWGDRHYSIFFDMYQFRLRPRDSMGRELILEARSIEAFYLGIRKLQVERLLDD